MLQKKILFILLIFSGFVQQLAAQGNSCGCSPCNLPIGNATQNTVYLQVSGASNNDLSASSQGLCKVSVQFSHPFIHELDLKLIGPTGQQVILLPSSSVAQSTASTNWRVDFVPCDSMSVPSMGDTAIFGLNTWANFQSIVGSYYPTSGCLEDFDLGPVNGTWRLLVTETGGTVFGGFLSAFSLEFCDMSGIDCSVGLPPVEASGNCAEAEVVPVLNQYLGSTYGATASDSTQGFCGTIENERWLAFVPTTAAMTITVIPGNCQKGDGLQAAVFSACDAPALACASGVAAGGATPLVLPLTNLQIGGTYYLLVDGFAGDECAFYVLTDPAFPSGLAIPEVPSGSSLVCTPSTHTYSIPPAYGAGGYEWTLPSGTFFQNGSNRLVQYGPNPTPVTVTWQNSGGNVCVRSFFQGDTSAYACRQVQETTFWTVELPLVRLCQAELPYFPPFNHPPITASGIYVATVPSTSGCDTLYRQGVLVSENPDTVRLAPVLIANDECYTPSPDLVFCDAGEHTILQNNSNGCPTLFIYRVNKLIFSPLPFACIPASVPLQAIGPDKDAISWILPGQAPVQSDTTEYFLNAVGTFGFSVLFNGQLYGYPALFTTATIPQAQIDLEQQDALVILSNGGSGNPTTYNWNFGNGQSASGNLQFHEYAANGTYTIVLTVSNPCGTDTDSTQVTVGTISEETPLSESSAFSVYPNPIQAGIFWVKTPTNRGKLTLVDGLGRKVWQNSTTEFSPSSATICGPFSFTGVYYLVWKDFASGQSIGKKLIFVEK